MHIKNEFFKPVFNNVMKLFYQIVQKYSSLKHYYNYIIYRS